MSDLISKKELYHKLGEAYNKGYLTWGANEIIKDIIGECDSVENKGEWIPISEENLPEDFQNVLVTIVRYDGTKMVRVAEYHENPKLSRKTFRILENNERWEVGEEQLLAWMPKPEPYKAESEKGGE